MKHDRQNNDMLSVTHIYSQNLAAYFQLLLFVLESPM